MYGHVFLPACVSLTLLEVRDQTEIGSVIARDLGKAAH